MIRLMHLIVAQGSREEVEVDNLFVRYDIKDEEPISFLDNPLCSAWAYGDCDDLQ